MWSVALSPGEEPLSQVDFNSPPSVCSYSRYSHSHCLAEFESWLFVFPGEHLFWHREPLQITQFLEEILGSAIGIHLEYLRLAWVLAWSILLLCHGRYFWTSPCTLGIKRLIVQKECRWKWQFCRLQAPQEPVREFYTRFRTFSRFG